MPVFAALALAAALAGTQISNDKRAAEEASPYLMAEGYQVYADLLPTDWTWKDADADLLVIQKETQRAESASCAPVKGKQLSGPWAEAMADYEKQNASPHILSAIIPTDKNYVLKSADEIKAAFRTSVNLPKPPNPKWGSGSGWEGFFAAFPQAKGYVVLSAPGFSQDGSKAVVYMGHHCGNLCGGGQLYFLEKNSQTGKWADAGKDSPQEMICGSWMA